MGKFEKDKKHLSRSGSWQDKMGILISKARIMPVPFALLKFSKQLKLTYFDVILVGYIFMIKQGKEWPYPSLNKLTRDCGIPQATLHNSLRRLRRDGFLETYPCKEKNPKGKRRNTYDLSGLIMVLENFISGKSGELLGSEDFSRADWEEFNSLTRYKNCIGITTKIEECNKTY
jgi:hypothetical protein